MTKNKELTNLFFTSTEITHLEILEINFFQENNSGFGKRRKQNRETYFLKNNPYAITSLIHIDLNDNKNKNIQIYCLPAPPPPPFHLCPYLITDLTKAQDMVITK